METLTNRILLIDDNPDNLELLVDLIEHAFPGYHTLTASSGLKGLELAASAHPDVILLDVVMPGMNGFEVCRKLKSDPNTSPIPVVFLTAIKSDREARLQAIEVGGEAFLSRPVDESELIAQIRAMQKIRRAASLLQDEKENLTSLVAAQTQALQQTHTATLNLLEDLHEENEARKRNEEALRDSEDKFRYLFEYSVAPKSITQLSGEVQVNQAFCDMLGYSREELEHLTWQEFTHPEDVKMNQDAIDSLLSGEKVTIRLTKRYIHKNGSTIWVDFGTALRRDKNGQPLYLISTFNDITERIHSQTLQEAIYRIAAATETAASLDELYAQIHQSISSVMPAENFYITLYDEVQNLLRISYFRDTKDEPFIKGIHPGRGRTAYVLRTGKSLLCTQAVHDELERRGEVDPLGVPSALWLGVPLIVEGKTIGVMVVQHYTDPNAYGEREQHILEFVSTQVAIAISRKQAEEALRESEIRYRGLFEHSPVSLWEEDYSAVKRHIDELRKAGVTDFRAYFVGNPQALLESIDEVKVVDVNAATLAMMKAADKDQLLGSLRQVIPIDANVNFLDEFVNVAEGLTEFAWEGKNYNLKHELLTVSVHWSVAPGYADSLGKVLVSVMDITERKQAEEALRESEERFHKAFEEGPLGMAMSEFSPGPFISVNTALCRMLGYTEEELKPLGFVNITHPDHRSEDAQAVRDVRDGKIQIHNTEKRYLKKNGEAIWASRALTRIASADGQSFYALAMIEDVTERKQAEEQIRQLNASLEQRVEERTRQLQEAQQQLVRQEKLATLGQLAGGVGHELRNPLGVINSAVYYLKLVQPDADEKIKKYHLMIEQEVNTASRIINDLLDFGRIITPDRQPVSIPELLQRVLTRFPAPPAVQVQLEIPASLPTVFADPLHLEQILGNLTTNACQAMKDSKDGGRLGISASQKKDQVAIAVKDTGTGISPEAMQRLFEPLFTTKLRGIGLGLAVSRKLAEANGGCIEVSSQPGQGSTFTLYLPVKQ